VTHPRFAFAVRPYARRELPAWGRVLRWSGVYDNDRWAGAPVLETRGKWHGYRMRLDLSDWSERHTYFLTRFSDLPTQLAIRSLVRPGETFVDIGANIGLMTLLGAHCVGPQGRVRSFEPNPRVFERLSGHVDSNGLRQVSLVNCGLGDADGELTLRVITEHTGMATFAEPTQAERATVSAEYRVPVRRADDLLADLIRETEGTPALMKVDVEGFECRVLRGAAGVLRTLRPAVILEIVPEYLARAGDSKEELFRILHDAGYEAFGARGARRWLRWRLALEPIDDPSAAGPQNFLWLHRDDAVHRQRVAASISVRPRSRS
jgi:FkbM family methyltransferase